MSLDDGTPERSPFSRPAWVGAAVLVGVLAIVGIVLSIMALTKPAAEPAPKPTTSESPAPTPSADAGDSKSLCGLDQVEMSGTLDQSPTIKWAFAGTTAFPTSTEFGPGAKSAGDIRTCFARTPEGASLAASVGVGYLMNAGTARAWQEYAIVPGAVRDQVLAGPAPTDQGNSSIRNQVTGVRLLSYDGKSAQVDVGVTVSGDGKSGYMSIVMPMVWQDGDWRVNYSPADLTAQPAQLPNLAGYVYWKE